MPLQWVQTLTYSLRSRRACRAMLLRTSVAPFPPTVVAAAPADVLVVSPPFVTAHRWRMRSTCSSSSATSLTISSFAVCRRLWRMSHPRALDTTSSRCSASPMSPLSMSRSACRYRSTSKSGARSLWQKKHLACSSCSTSATRCGFMTNIRSALCSGSLGRKRGMLTKPKCPWQRSLP
ncbi:hypothetical protein DQ04_13101000 [Trypanosoma grayi]|uniref:hypothetical protein n=1 Tax=Trypanosoma grayi TaxID=71804 RepID=UPI0004F4B789|nr:hypothetical protein DQ04_13101000 [Trypanosoma grayi]KEG06604.1 hypothetical protein DQ04_13101000 [Trypanosoma grayi]